MSAKIDINKIKPDPNQPRKAFDDEKMAELVASMESQGFNPNYPILLDLNNKIIDGERRFRAAKEAELEEVYIVMQLTVQTDSDRLVQQLQSAGAELKTFEKYQAWAKLYEMNEGDDTKKALAEKLGIAPETFKKGVNRYRAFALAVKSVEKSMTDLNKNGTAVPKLTTLYHFFYPLSLIGREENETLREKLVSKALKEKWGEERTVSILKLIHEHPDSEKNILMQDYSEHWRERLLFQEDEIKTGIEGRARQLSEGGSLPKAPTLDDQEESTSFKTTTISSSSTGAIKQVFTKEEVFQKEFDLFISGFQNVLKRFKNFSNHSLSSEQKEQIFFQADRWLKIITDSLFYLKTDAETGKQAQETEVPEDTETEELRGGE